MFYVKEAGIAIGLALAGSAVTLLVITIIFVCYEEGSMTEIYVGLFVLGIILAVMGVGNLFRKGEMTEEEKYTQRRYRHLKATEGAEHDLP